MTASRTTGWPGTSPTRARIWCASTRKARRSWPWPMPRRRNPRKSPARDANRWTSLTDFGVSHTRKPAFGSGFHTRPAYYRPFVTWPAAWRRRFVTNAADNESLVTARGADRCGRVTKMLRATGEAGQFWFGVSHTRTALVRGITHTCSGFHTHFL